MKTVQIYILMGMLLSALACSKKNNEAPPAKEAATQPAPAAKPAPVAQEAPAVKDGVRFLNVKDGATLSAQAALKFGVSGKTIRPAGEDVEDKTSGHHHVIIDGAAMPEGTVIPMDDKHKHYGKGQTETVLTLSPGAHTLTLQFADGAHRSYGPAWSQTIKVTVAAAEAPAEAAAPPAAAPPVKKEQEAK